MWTRNDNWSSLPFMDQLTHSFVPTFSPLSFLPFLFFLLSFSLSSLSLFSSLSSSVRSSVQIQQWKRRKDGERMNGLKKRGLRRQKWHWTPRNGEKDTPVGGWDIHTHFETSSFEGAEWESLQEREREKVCERERTFMISLCRFSHTICVYICLTRNRKSGQTFEQVNLNVQSKLSEKLS